jgi:glucosamine--fructose-6-phosphate aminotransferase (isomerizing)
LVAKYYLESIAGLPCEVDYASEFRYRDVILNSKTLVVAISQSGETADTVAAVELARTVSPTVAICNVLGSSLARRVDATVFTHAGPEISVASTKAFTTQLTAMYLFAVFMGQLRKRINNDLSKQLIHEVVRLPSAIDESLKTAAAIEKVSKEFYRAKSFLFLGRGLCYPIALEGALKLKEISYIHAEGYPAGEIKHGPLALVDEEMPVVVLLQRDDRVFEKTFSNLREVHSRQGKIIAITDHYNLSELDKFAHTVVTVPHLSVPLGPLLMTIPLQFLAYYIAVLNGSDVDLPRNLAKSVTVE